MSIDTVNDLPPRVQYVASVAQVDFDYPFPIFVDADLIVDVDGVTQVLATDYTVSGEGDDAGGTVTLIVPATGGEIVTIYRNLAIERITDFQQNGEFSSTAFNDELDRITLVQQELRASIGRALRVGMTDTGTDASFELPAKASRLGKYLYFNGTTGLPEMATALTGSTLSASAINGYINGIVGAETSAGLVVGDLDIDYEEPGLQVDARRYGVIADGVVDDTNALTTAILVASQTVNSALGAVVALPHGTILTSSMITLPNRVTLRGSNGRGTIIKATAGHSGPWMFHAKPADDWLPATVYAIGDRVTNDIKVYTCDTNGTSAGSGGPTGSGSNIVDNTTRWDYYSSGSMFNSHLEELSVDCNNVAALGGVRTQAWQENCGMRRCIVQNFRTTGLQIDDTYYGGAATMKLEDTEFFGSTSGATYGIDIQSVSAAGNFVVTLDNVIVSGGLAAPLTAGVNLVTDSIVGSAVHFENCTNGFLLSGPGSVTLANCTGASTVTDLIEVAAGFTGALNMLGCKRASATNFINNLVISETITGAVTDPVQYVYPNLNLSGALRLRDGMPAPSTLTGYANVYVDTADGDLKVKFADGATRVVCSDEALANYTASTYTPTRSLAGTESSAANVATVLCTLIDDLIARGILT